MVSGKFRNSVLGNLSLAPIALAVAILIYPPIPSQAEEPKWQSAATLFGVDKYAAGFKHYDYVNPQAPQGGTLNSTAYGAFDSFNPFIIRGTAAAGLAVTGGLLYDNLFDQSTDQPAASHAMVAEAFRRGEDYSWAEYRLNPKAKFHDGMPITPQDVVWTAMALKENHPFWNSYFHNVTSIVAIDDKVVRFEFNQKGNRELPQIMGDMPVLPKHWWTGKDGKGKQRDIAKPITEPPLGSGPYKIDKFELGKSLTWKKVADYWAQNEPTRIGRYNFETINYKYFLDQDTIWEAFKKGDGEDIRRENSSRSWATEYVFPAVEKGNVIKQTFPDKGPKPYQAYFLNTRRAKLANAKVREALNYLFDFETMNKNLFYGAYTRTDSPFEGGELQSTGLPQGNELAILEPFRKELDPRLFTEEFKLPVLGDQNAIRKAQRHAQKLFVEAGYTFVNGQMTGADGKPFEIEILGVSDTDEKIGIPFIENLKKIGIKASLRIVDTSQYQNRVNDFDFDMISTLTAMSLSPGNELRDYWSATSAERKGTQNYSGVHSPVVDQLVDKIIAAKDRQELVDTTRALDRVLKWGFYTIPEWHNANAWLAYWKKIKFPPTQPDYIGVDIWSSWVDPQAGK